MVISLSDDHKGYCFERGMCKVLIQYFKRLTLIEGIDEFLSKTEHNSQEHLTQGDWDELELMMTILEVCG